MPTKEQMLQVTDAIELFMGGLEVVRLEGDRIIAASASREGEYRFWNDLLDTQRRDALAIVVDWHGFTEAQKDVVVQRVIDGEEPEFWMDGIDAVKGHDPDQEQFKAIMRGEYGQFLEEATERALARMEGKEGGHER